MLMTDPHAMCRDQLASSTVTRRLVSAAPGEALLIEYEFCNALPR
jgi:hypothetical protein